MRRVPGRNVGDRKVIQRKKCLWVGLLGEGLSLRDFFQGLKKGWVRNSGGLGSANECFSMGPQSGDGKGYGDAVIAERVELGTVERLISRNGQTVFALFQFRAHEAEVGG